MNPQHKLNYQSRNLSASRSRGLFDNLFSSDIGDTPNTAKNIGTLKRGSSYKKSGDVGGFDLDFFKFRVDQTTNFSARLRNDDNNDQPIAMTILNRDGDAVSLHGNFLFRNVDPGQTDTISAAGLPKGEYFVRLESVDGNNENYDLKLSRSRSKANDWNGSGERIGELQPDRQYRYSGSVGDNDIDFYRFNIDSLSRFTAYLSNSSNDPIAISVLDSSNRVVQTANGRFLFANADPDRSVELFAPTLPAGSYRVRVQSEFGSREPYQLALGRTDYFY